MDYNRIQTRKNLFEAFENGVLIVRQCQNWFKIFRSDITDIDESRAFPVMHK
jgi:hypothetical protein